MTFGTKLRIIFERLRTPLAYAIVLAAAALRFTQWKEATYGLLVALCLIILPIIFEIHKKFINEKHNEFFTSFTYAAPTIESVLDRYMSNTKEPKVLFLGSALVYQYPILKNFLSNNISKFKSKKSEIEIALINPGWKDTAHIDEALPNQVNGTILELKKFIKQYSHLIEKHNWPINLYTYDYLPQKLGILVGENDLFLCGTYWEKGSLYGGGNSVEHIKSSDNNLAIEKIREFQSWFSYSKQKKIEII